MSFVPKPHEIYKHFKGNLYQITAIAEHTETGETLVVYQAMYGDFKTYARPLAMFISPVDREKYPDAAQEFRFELQGPDAARQKAEMGDAVRNTGTGACRRTECPDPHRAASGEKSAEPVPTAQSRQENADSGEPFVQKPGENTAAAGREMPGPQSGEPVGPAEQPGSGPEEESEEFHIDPLVLEFLDADSYEQRLNILAGLHHRITDDMITTMAIACDVEISDGDIEERYESLKMCLLTMERYECNRLR